MKKNIKMYMTLFLSAMQISAFTFGGGYVIIPMLKRKFVDKLGWIGEDEMLDLTAIAQSAPGAVAVNASVLVGYRIAGLPGAAVTALGTVIPPLVILSVISVFYEAFKENTVIGYVLRGMRAGVAAVILDVVITMSGNVVKNRAAVSVVIMSVVFVLSFFLKINVVYIILACALCGALFMRGKEDKR